MAGNPREGSSPLHDGIGLAATITRDFVASDPSFGLASDHTRDASGERGDDVAPRPRRPDFAGDHSIVRLIGAGGMGSVFEARAPDGTTVALKFISDSSPERLYRFKREFRTLSAIVHPNLVELYELLQVDAGGGESNVFFTMERLHGEHFVAAARRDYEPLQPLDDPGLRRLQHCLVGLASGLACIHRHGLVHRDVKPSNVMVTAAGRVVVLDLGLVREVRSASLDSAAIVGTPLYMAPEQIINSESVGPPADWFAVGEILWESLTGALRHQGSLHAMLEHKLTRDPLPPSSEGVAVPPELDRLCLDLLARDPAARPTAAEVLTRLGRADLVAIEVVTHGLVGRASETKALLAAILAARSGQPSVAAISGRSGFGKTTVVAHVVELARREHGLLAFTGHCSERESIPFKALDTALDELAVHLCNHPDDLTRASPYAQFTGNAMWADTTQRAQPALPADSPLPAEIAALARLFPVLRSVPQIRELDDSHFHGTDPVQVFRHAADALADLLTRVAAGRPLVLVLDNLQWADLDSVQLLESVLLRPQPPPLALLCSFHEGADTTRPPLMRLLAKLRAADHVQMHALAIGPFSDDQASALAAHHLGLEPADPLPRRIAREAQGSPFFIGELARFARARGGLGESIANLNLDEVIRLRLQALPPAARRLVEILAIAGGRLPRAVALKVVAATAGAVDRGTLARLRAEHLLRADASDDDNLETFHDRIRSTAANDAHASDPAGLRDAHRIIAEALLVAGDADKATLAHHFRAAKDTARATHFTLLAAEEAAAQLAFERAAELFAALLELGGLGPREATRVRIQLAESLANSGQLYAAAQAYREAADHGEGATEAERSEWLRIATVQLLQTGQHDEGKATLERLLPRVGLRMTHGLASTIFRLLAQRFILAFRRLALPRSRGPELAEAAAQRLDVCWTATRGLIYVDGITSALFHARHLGLALDSGDPVRAARAIGFEAYLRVVMKGSPAAATSFATLDSLDAAPAVQQSPYARGMLCQYRASTHQMLCRFAAALPIYEQGMTILRSQCTGEMHEVAQMQAHHAMSLLYLGRVDALREAAALLVRDCSARPNPYVEGFARGLLGNIVGLATDAVDEAAEHMATYRRDAPKRFEVHYFNWSCQRAELERYRGDGEQAWALHREDTPTIEKMAFLRTPWVAVEFQRARACNALALAVRRKDPREQLAIARKAAKRCLKQPLPMAEAYGRLALAGAAALARHDDIAVRELRRAVSVFDELQMASYLAASRRRLAALLGGDEGRELLRLADHWAAAEHVRRPDRYTDMMAPGFHPQS
ncbi:MAG: AAA family ATPase [Nannocystis sp.]|uniref:serine/threonine-protein kinase n=1 Tax=Nannocystis sp. TaxID=1962667 RepID=UPI002426A914|nr:serine/threonine-protein kinase [Nannocystis sp.]MBK9754608.1 AAA family ATPase [Nannocystis sp.]